MDSKELKEFIKFVSKLDVHEISLDVGDVKLKIKNGSSEKTPAAMVPQQIISAPATVVPTNPTQPAEVSTGQPSSTENSSNYIEIKSPMIGTLYHRPSPDKEPFVKVGDFVKAGDPVCTIEAMKLFNEIESDISGKIIKVLVDDSTPVEYGQPLFLVDPS